MLKFGSSKKSYIVLGLLIGAYFFSYFFRVSASVVLPRLAAEMSISSSLTGFISSLYFYAYAVMQPVSGALNDRFGPQVVVSIGLLITASGSMLFAVAHNIMQLAVGRTLLGLGLAPMLSGVLVYQSRHFSPEKYSFLTGLTYAIGNFGAVVSVAPLGWAIDNWGRLAVFASFFIATAILSLALLMSREKRLSISPREVGSDGAGIIGRLGIAFRKIIVSRQLKAMSILWMVSFGALMSLQGLWAVSWYSTVYEIPMATASNWATLIGVGVMCGNWIGSNAGRSIKRRKAAIITASLFNAASWAAITLSIFLKWPLTITGSIGFLIGIFSGASYTHLTAGVNDISSNGNGGALFGAMNLFTFSSVILFQWGTGVLLSVFSGSSTPPYPATSFLPVFMIVAALVVASQLATLLLKDFSVTEDNGISRRTHEEEGR